MWATVELSSGKHWKLYRFSTFLITATSLLMLPCVLHNLGLMPLKDPETR